MFVAQNTKYGKCRATVSHRPNKAAIKSYSVLGYSILVRNPQQLTLSGVIIKLNKLCSNRPWAVMKLFTILNLQASNNLVYPMFQRQLLTI